jgi:hypothetical protein
MVIPVPSGSRRHRAARPCLKSEQRVSTTALTAARASIRQRAYVVAPMVVVPRDAKVLVGMENQRRC